MCREDGWDYMREFTPIPPLESLVFVIYVYCKSVFTGVTGSRYNSAPLVRIAVRRKDF